MTAFERIRDVWVPEWLQLFEKKSADYNTKATAKRPAFQPHEVLGIKGQWADIWRKVWKLHKALWDDEQLTGEQPREIILDLISHLFLTIDLMEKQSPLQLPEPGTYRAIKKITGHGYDGCPACVKAQQESPEVIA